MNGSLLPEDVSNRVRKRALSQLSRRLDLGQGKATVSVASRFVHCVFGVPAMFPVPVIHEFESQNRSTLFAPTVESVEVVITDDERTRSIGNGQLRVEPQPVTANCESRQYDSPTSPARPRTRPATTTAADSFACRVRPRPGDPRLR